MKTDVGLKIIALVFFLAAGQPVLAYEDAGKDAYVDSLMSIVRPMRDRERLVPAAQEFMDFLDHEGFTDGKIIIPDRCPVDSVRALTWYWASDTTEDEHYSYRNYSYMDFTADNITGENTSNKKNEAVVRTISGSSYNGFSVRCVKSIE